MRLATTETPSPDSALRTWTRRAPPTWLNAKSGTGNAPSPRPLV
jgi:hypothetical protein